MISAQQIRTLMLGAGAFDARVIPAEAVDGEYARRYREWLDEGCNASMTYLEKYPEVRDDPRLLLDDVPAGSLIIGLFPYFSAENVTSPHIADYALGRDYHIVLRERLSPVLQHLIENYGGSGRICVDTAPLRERYWAARAGLGRVGRNGQLTVPGKGASFFIATVIWSGEPEDMEDLKPMPVADTVCGTCRRCVDACPGGALRGDGTLDARRCLSCLTIESNEPLPADIRLHGNIYGCDVCRRVCPHFHSGGCLDEFVLREDLAGMTLADWANLRSGQAKRLFRDSAMRRVRPERLRYLASVISAEENAGGGKMA